MVYYGCARQTAAASIRRRTRTNGARGPCARRRAESVLRSASSGCGTRSRLRRKRVLMQRLHAPCTRKARAMHGKPRGGRLTLGDMPMEARQDLPPATKADRILTKVRAARWRAVQDPRGAAADERQMLRTRTAWRHARKQKRGQNNGRTTNKRTLLASAAVRMQPRCTLHYVCCMLCTARGYALSRHAICEVARAHGLHAECAHPPQDA